MAANGYVDDGKWEIEELAASEGGESMRHGSVGGGDDVYVAVGKGSSSMAAFSWALKNVARPKDFVYLIHVYPEVQHIPTPLGMLPKDQVTPEQVEIYMNVERSKRIQLLQPFFKLGDASKVIMDTVLIESDTVANAIIELIPVLHIRRLVMGVSKSNARAMKRGAGKAGQVLKKVPEYCEVTVISDGGKRVSLEEEGASPSPQPERKDSLHRDERDDESGSSDMASCTCFSRKFR